VHNFSAESFKHCIQAGTDLYWIWAAIIFDYFIRIGIKVIVIS